MTSQPSVSNRPQDSRTKRIIRVISGNFTWLLAALAFVILAMTTKSFTNAVNLRNILLQTTVMSLLVLGAAAVMIAGYMDIAIEDKLIMATAVGAWLISPHPNASGWLLPSWLGVLVPIVVISIVGLIQATCILKLQMNPWMTSMSVAMIITGLGTILLHGAQLFPMPADYRRLGIGTIGPIHISLIVVLLFFVGAFFILTRRPLGREWYATGANARAARASGVNIHKIVTMALVFSGIMGAIAGWMWLGRTNAIDMTFGKGLTFEVIAAAVMGGISLKGGRGDVLRAWSGILLLTLISNGLNLNNVPPYWVAASRGMLIFLATLIDGLRTRAEG